MGIRVDVLPLDVNTPGHGLLRITGWQGFSEGLQCSLQSNQTLEFLHEGGKWNTIAHWFRLDGMTEVDGGKALETRVGPNLINPLLQASGSANFRIEVSNPVLGESDVGMVRLNPALVASGDLGPVLDQSPAPSRSSTAAPEAPPVVPEPVVEPEPVASKPVVAVEPIEPPPPPPPPLPPVVPAKSGNRWLLPVLLLAVLALIAAGGAWWWFNKKDQTVVPEPVPAPAPPAPAPEPTAGAPCTLESMQSQPELAFVQACIQNKPDAATLLEVIKQAKANNHCGVAQRLYANRAQGGDIEIASAYAHEYDPKYHQPSECFKAPDNATAAYWYETILGVDENNAEAKARYEELKP